MPPWTPESGEPDQPGQAGPAENTGSAGTDLTAVPASALSLGQVGRKRRRSAMGGGTGLAWDADRDKARKNSDRHSENKSADTVPGLRGRILASAAETDHLNSSDDHPHGSTDDRVDGRAPGESNATLRATAERVARARLTDKALGYLARRDHSAQELEEKLSRKDEHGFSHDIVKRLTADNLQSDQRFAEHLGRVRVGAGKGPMVLYREFQRHRIDPVIVEEIMAEYENQWLALAEQARVRKFGEERPVDYKTWARQARFLQQRGFSSHHIKRHDRD